MENRVVEKEQSHRYSVNGLLDTSQLHACHPGIK